MEKTNKYETEAVNDDLLEMMTSEIEDLENDELSLSEAGFMRGYNEAEDEEWVFDED
jgi:hypothetical protein